MSSNIKSEDQTSNEAQDTEIVFPSCINFDLKTYDISLTWIAQNLDSIICGSVRWLELPISTCVSEMLSLPTSKGGFGIVSTTETLHLEQCYNLKHSVHTEMNDQWL